MYLIYQNSYYITFKIASRENIKIVKFVINTHTVIFSVNSLYVLLLLFLFMMLLKINFKLQIIYKFIFKSKSKIYSNMAGLSHGFSIYTSSLGHGEKWFIKSNILV